MALGGALALAAPVRLASPARARAVEVRHDVEYGTANGKRLLLDAYVPATGKGVRPAVVLIHGGGWRLGDKAWWADEAQRFADRGWVAFSVNYRLDEPSAFPAEIDDVQAAVRWVRAHAGEYRVDPTRVAAAGDSAGGHLTAMLATLGSGSLDEGARIRVGAAWSPPVDLLALAGSRGDGWVGPIVGCTLTTCPDVLAQASPVNHVDGTDAPLYLVNSTDELVPLTQARVMAERLKMSGVDHRLDVFEGARHGLDLRADAWAPTLAFFEAHLGAHPDLQPATEDENEASSGAPAAVLGGIVAAVAVAGSVVLRRRRRPGP